MAPHSSTLAWKIPWTEEPGRLQSMGLLRVGHNRATSLSLFTFMHWRKKWQPTPVFLPGESQERGSLVGCRLWGRTESDTTEATQQQQHVNPQELFPAEPSCVQFQFTSHSELLASLVFFKHLSSIPSIQYNKSVSSICYYKILIVTFMYVFFSHTNEYDTLRNLK